MFKSTLTFYHGAYFSHPLRDSHFLSVAHLKSYTANAENSPASHREDLPPILLPPAMTHVGEVGFLDSLYIHCLYLLRTA